MTRDVRTCEAGQGAKAGFSRTSCTRNLPIAEHGLIGDLHTAALVGTDGTIDWYCCYQPISLVQSAGSQSSKWRL